MGFTGIPDLSPLVLLQYVALTALCVHSSFDEVSVSTHVTHPLLRTLKIACAVVGPLFLSREFGWRTCHGMTGTLPIGFSRLSMLQCVVEEAPHTLTDLIECNQGPAALAPNGGHSRVLHSLTTSLSACLNLLALPRIMPVNNMKHPPVATWSGGKQTTLPLLTHHRGVCTCVHTCH